MLLYFNYTLLLGLLSNSKTIGISKRGYCKLSIKVLSVWHYLKECLKKRNESLRVEEVVC